MYSTLSYMIFFSCFLNCFFLGMRMHLFIVMTCILGTKSNLLQFVKDYQVTLYEKSVIQQVKINTNFLPLEKKFYTALDAFLTNKSEKAKGEAVSYLMTCKVLLADIRRIYDNVPLPYKKFEVEDDNIWVETIDYVTEDFQTPALLPIYKLIEKTTEIDYDVLAFNLFRLHLLLLDLYEKYTAIINGSIELPVIKQKFQKQIGYSDIDILKRTFIAAGQSSDQTFAVYSLEILSSPVTIQCFSILPIANFSLEYPHLCEYQNTGVIFSGQPPMSPLSLIVKYDTKEYHQIQGNNIDDIIPFLIPTNSEKFAENMVGAVQFNNERSKLPFNFPKKNSFSPILTGKSISVKIGELFMKFQNKKSNPEIITNSNSDQKLRQLIDDAFSFFPEELQLLIIILAGAVLAIILGVFISIKCVRHFKMKNRKKREQAQIRTVNFLSLPTRRTNPV